MKNRFLELYENSPKITIFLVVFLWALTVGLAIQTIILPFIFPNLHYGDGLMRGGDWIHFHEKSLELVAKITEFGWSSWELRPFGWFPVGFSSAVYKLTGVHSPWVILPFNAILFSLSAVFLYEISLSIFSSKKFAIISIFPFVFFPSSALIYSQIHKDVFSLCGIMLIISVWLELHQHQKTTLNKLFKGIVLSSFGILLIWIARPYLLLNILLAALAAFSILMIFASRNRNRLWWISSILYLIMLIIPQIDLKLADDSILSNDEISILSNDEISILSNITPQQIDLILPDDSIVSNDEIIILGNDIANILINLGLSYDVQLQKVSKIPNQTLKQLVKEKIIKNQDEIIYSENKSNFIPEFLVPIDRKIHKIVKDLNSTRKGFNKIDHASSSIDKDISFNKLTDVLLYLPRAIQISLLAPFPNMWTADSNTPGGSIMRLISGFEMIISYFLLIGVVYILIFRTTSQISALMALTMALSLTIIIVLAVNNVGALYRMRFASWHIINSIGVIGCILLWRRYKRFNLNLTKYTYQKLVITYLALKSISVIGLILFLPSIFGQSYFNYEDFSSSYSSCNINAPNGFYNILICSLGIENISNFKAIFVAFFINSLRDLLLIAIIVKQKILKPKSLLFFVIILSLHPYLGLYHAKLTTSIFAVFGMVLLYYVLIKSKAQSLIIDAAFIIIVGLRNSFAGVIIPFYLIEIVSQITRIKNGKSNVDYFLLKNIVFLFLAIVTLMLSGDYIFNFVYGSSVYSVSMEFFIQFINTPFILIDKFLAFLISFFTHAFLLLGFREAAYTQFPEFFTEWTILSFLYIAIGVIFSFVHGLGFYQFIKVHLINDKRFIIFLIILLPTLFSVAHLRYFMPFIPLALLGLSIFVDQKKY